MHRVRRTACHAEGRGFESHQTLFKRPAFAGLFCVRSRLVRLRRVGLTPDSPRGPSSAFQGKRPVCRPILVRPNRSTSAGLQRSRVPPAGCNATILWTAPAGAIPAVAVLGAQSGFSPETARSTSPLLSVGKQTSAYLGWAAGCRAQQAPRGDVGDCSVSREAAVRVRCRRRLVPRLEALAQGCRGQSAALPRARASQR
jgi:hypothetical protein